jgi:hypothetical protein
MRNNYSRVDFPRAERRALVIRSRNPPLRDEFSLKFSELSLKEEGCLMYKAQRDVGNDLGRASHRKRFD